MKVKLFALIAVVAMLISSCGKNEFAIDMNLSNGGTQNLRFLYLASSDDQKFVADNMLPLIDGQLHLDGVTRYPTIVFVFNAQGELLTSIYAEKGDKIKVGGDITKPFAWTVEGNSTAEEFAQWTAQNSDALASRNPRTINKAINAYFASKHDDRVAALMLYTLYSSRIDEDGYRKLAAMLPDDDDIRRIRIAAMMAEESDNNRASALTVTPLTLLSMADTMMVVNPAKHYRTVIYMWYDTPDRQAMRQFNAAAEGKDVEVVDICMNPDTVSWRQNVRYSSDDHPMSTWAIGGENNVSLTRLAIPRFPYIIVTDRKGTQLYRGDDTNESLKSLK